MFIPGKINAMAGAIPKDMVGDPAPSDNSINTLAQWFTNQTGNEINATYFASYVTLAIGNKLYIGLSAARPGESDGGLLASFDGSLITPVSILTEQGANDFATYGNLLFSTGSDPSDAPPPGGHQWDGGNFYSHDTVSGILSKYRCTLSDGACLPGTYVLPNVLHGFGLYVNTSGHIFMSVGADDGTHPGTCVNGVDCFGEIHKSTDFGATWTRIARFATTDPSNPITSYRIYDIIGFNDKLYATYVAEYDQQGFLAESLDNGLTWNNVATMPSLHNRGRLFVYKNKLIGMGYNRDTLYGMDTDGNITTYQLGFTVGSGIVTEYNFFAQDNRGNLFTISSDGVLKQTSSLTSWTDYSNLNSVANSNKFASISYWENRDSMIISGMGTAAKIWIIDISPPPLSPAGPTTCTGKNLDAPVLYQPGHKLLPFSATPGEITLNWLSVEGASSYNISYGEKSGEYKYGLVGIRGNGGVISQRIGHLINNKKYYYVVRATDGCSFSPYSNEWGVSSTSNKNIQPNIKKQTLTNLPVKNIQIEEHSKNSLKAVGNKEVTPHVQKGISAILQQILSNITSIFKHFNVLNL